MSNNTVEYSIKLVDQSGKTLAVFNNGIDNAYKKVNLLNASLNKAKKDPYETQNRSLALLRDRLDRYKSAAESSFRLDHIKKYNILIDKTNEKIKKIENTAKTCKQKTDDLFDDQEKSGFLSKLNANFGIGKGLIGAGIILSLGRTALSKSKESIEAASTIEKYEVSLKNMLGSSEAARNRMQEYFDIAKKTPFDMTQVIEVGNQLQALGKYSKDNVTMLGDLAAATGKPMEQALGAYAKMASGQKGLAVDMFRSLMITTKDWTEATGKGVSKNGELLASTDELLAALPKIMKAKGFLGLMATQSNTTEGKVANLDDALFQLKVAMGERMKPAYTSFIEGSSRVVEKMNRWIEVPIEQKIAAEKSELNALVNSLINSTDNEAKRSTIIDELQAKYGDFIKNINLEKASTEDLRKELEKTNKEYDKKMRQAALKRQIEKLEGEMAEDMDDIVEYEISINAKKELYKSKQQEQLLLKTILGDKPDILNYSFDNDGNIMYQPVSNGPFGTPQKQKIFNSGITDEQRQEAIFINANMNAQRSLMTFWGFDEKRKQKVQQSWEKKNLKLEAINRIINGNEIQNRKDLLLQAQGVDVNDKTTYQKLFGTENLKNEFDNIVKLAGTSFEKVSDDQWERLSEFVKGDAIFKKALNINNSDPNSNSILQDAESTITGGGRSVKQVIINLESLIGINNNNFEKGETPMNKQEFQEQLKTALMGILNDANKVA